MSVKYIGDTHLFDNYALEWRPQYTTMDDYADLLIRKWNERTSPDDTVIHVGDIGLYCKKTLEVMHELNGHLVLVLGNHDIEWGDKVYTCGLFQGVFRYITQKGLYICHKPDAEVAKDTYYIHGHHHTYATLNMQVAWQSYIQDAYRLNCAADLIGNRPLTLNELIVCKEELILNGR